MKKAVWICLIALLISVFLSVQSNPEPVDHKLISIQAQEQLGGFPGLENEPIELKAAVIDLGNDPLLLLKARAALMVYPEMARKVLPLYAFEPEFRQILASYGEHALPPIHYFLQNSVSSIELMNKAARQYDRVKAYIDELGGAESEVLGGAEPLSPAERGWYAVNFIRSEGHDFLGQFVVDDAGQTQWVQTERVTEGIAQFFTSGVRQLETQYRAGNDIAASDIGWASVDVLVFASAVKVLRAGRTAAGATQGARLSTRSAALAARITASGRLILSSARYARWPLIVGAGYLVVTHPSLINDFFAEAADVLGMPPMLIQLAGWLLIVVPVFYLASWLIWPAIGLLRGLQALLYRLVRR